jgi:protein-S-isoprenylcysteine O-methyltransferase Ste14
MHAVRILVFAAMVAYVGWWLIYAIRKRIAFEVEMALGVGSLWAAILVAMTYENLPDMVILPPILSLAGWVLFYLSIGLFVLAIISLHRGGKPTSGWEHTTELTTSGIYGLVRHPMQLCGILGACAIVMLSPTLATLVLGGVSFACFALAAPAEDQFNVAKFGDSYRAYMKQVPALNLLAGIRRQLRSSRKR